MTKHPQPAWPCLALVVGLVAGLLAGAPARADSVGPYYATPSWDQTLVCSTSTNCPRFIGLSNLQGEAVLDRETGLVWERSPGTAATQGAWAAAFRKCHDKRTGGRMGWRLPTISELTSLADSEVYVPVHGSPFFAEQSAGIMYWSATTDELLADSAYALGIHGKPNFTSLAKTYPWGRVWCVRGGQG